MSSWTGNLSAILALRGLYLSIDTQDPCQVRFVVRGAEASKRVGILPGSFHPPTLAHLALLETAEKHLQLDELVLSFGRQIVGKAQSGITPWDRLLMLVAVQQSRPKYSVAISSGGLYADLAEGYANALPGAKLYFMVGFDKIEQIMDPRYYQNRDTALERLFSKANMAVSGRGDRGSAALEVLFAKPENQKFSKYIEYLPLDPRFEDFSSTRIRDEAVQGRIATDEVSTEVADFLRDSYAFQPNLQIGSEKIDRYLWRGAIVEIAAEAASAHGDVNRILSFLLSSEGKLLRRKLRHSDITWSELREAAYRFHV